MLKNHVKIPFFSEVKRKKYYDLKILKLEYWTSETIMFVAQAEIMFQHYKNVL